MPIPLAAAEAPSTFERELPLDPKLLPEVYAVDGSRLEKVAPEILSVDKLSPTLIDHYIKATCVALGSEVEGERVHAEHPRITRPEARLYPPWLRIRISDHLLEKRKEERKKRHFCTGRPRATSYNLIAGAKKLLQS